MSAPAVPNEFEVLLKALAADLQALKADVSELKRSVGASGPSHQVVPLRLPSAPPPAAPAAP